MKRRLGDSVVRYTRAPLYVPRKDHVFSNANQNTLRPGGMLGGLPVPMPGVGVRLGAIPPVPIPGEGAAKPVPPPPIPGEGARPPARPPCARTVLALPATSTAAKTAANFRCVMILCSPYYWLHSLPYNKPESASLKKSCGVGRPPTLRFFCDADAVQHAVG
jgi:hypothetical protein